MASADRFILPDELFYDREEHLWVRREPEGLRIGIDALGLDALGEVVHLDLVPEGTLVSRGEPLGSVEAEKMVRPLIAPASGRVLRRNEAALRRPPAVSQDPYGSGWLVLLEPTRWEEEARGLVHGEAVAGWLEAEVSAYAEKGWIR